MPGSLYMSESLKRALWPEMQCSITCKSNSVERPPLSFLNLRRHVNKCTDNHQCLLTTGCTKADMSAFVQWIKPRTHACTQTHTLFGHTLLSLNKYRGPSVRRDKDAIGNIRRSAVTKQLLNEWLRKGTEELTHSSCDVKDVRRHTHTHTHYVV